MTKGWHINLRQSAKNEKKYAKTRIFVKSTLQYLFFFVILHIIIRGK